MSNVVNGSVPDTGLLKGSISTIYAKDGKDGFSPTIEVSEVENGLLVTVTDVNGTNGFEVRNGIDGSDGDSAYLIACDNGFEGTEEEWLASLHGKDGEKGEPGNSGVYVGSGDMPADCNVQIDPVGEAVAFDEVMNKYITPEMYGAVGDGVTDDSGAFQKMLDDRTKADYPILLTAKNYRFKSTVIDTIGHTFLPNTSELTAYIANADDAFMGDYVFVVDIKENKRYQGKFNYNLNITAGQWTNGFKIASSIGNKFNLVIKNAVVGFYLNRRDEESTGSAIYENEINVRVDWHLANGNTALGTTGVYVEGNDNFFDNVVVINYTTGIENLGNSHYKYVHCWLSPDIANIPAKFENSVCFRELDKVYSATIEHLYADTYGYGVDFITDGAVKIGTYYALVPMHDKNQTTDYVYKHRLFKGPGRVYIDMFATYQDYNHIVLVSEPEQKLRLVIKNAQCTGLLNTAPMNQLVFPFGITKDYPAKDSLPAELKTALEASGGVVRVTPLSGGGSNGCLATYWAVNKLFLNFELDVKPDNWIPVSYVTESDLEIPRRYNITNFWYEESCYVNQWGEQTKYPNCKVVQTNDLGLYAGKTIKVKTCAFGDMGYVVGGPNWEYLQGGVSGNTSADNCDWEFEIVVPENAKWLLVSYYTGTGKEFDFYVEEKEKIADVVADVAGYVRNEASENPLNIIRNDAGLLSVFRRVGCIGDSLASGLCVYKKADGTEAGVDLYEFSWGQFLARMTGNTYYNFSRGGWSTKNWLNGDFGYHLAFDGNHPCDAYIIGLGQNDVNQNLAVGTSADIDLNDCANNADTYYGRYAKIIQEIQKRYPKAKIFVCTDPIDKETSPENNGYNAAVREISAMFPNVYLLDLYRYGKELYDYNGSNLLSVNKRYAHFNAVGYFECAKIIATYIDWIMKKNPEEFREVEFINTDYSYYGE